MDGGEPRCNIDATQHKYTKIWTQQETTKSLEWITHWTRISFLKIRGYASSSIGPRYAALSEITGVSIRPILITPAINNRKPRNTTYAGVKPRF